VQNEYRRVVDALPGLVWSALPDGQVDFLNQRWCEYAGLSLEEARGWGWQSAICPEDLPGLLDCCHSILASGEPGEIEARMRRFDGTYRWFLFRGLALRDPRGRIARWHVLLTDIEDRKRAEALLTGERRLLEMVASGGSLPVVLEALCSLVEHTADGCLCSVLLIDPSGTRIHYVAAPGLPSTYTGVLPGRLVNAEGGPCTMAASRKTQVIASDVASDTRWDVNGWRTLALTHGIRACWSTPILSSAGKALGTFAIFQREPASPTPLQQDLIGRFTHLASIAIERAQDEAALNELRSELAHVARVTTLGALTASIAHEVNQPLSGIITNASTCLRMLADDPPNVDGARETARRTIRDGNRASEVIARLRALFGKQGTAAESVDLNEATREVIALSSNELQQGRVSVRAELADDLPPVIGDRVQLQQVVLNLVRNAADAMRGVEDRPRQLLVRTERDDGDRVRLSVQDAGSGLDPESLDRLFEAFYTTKSGGMGIGLSVCRSIIESHHGRLWAAPNDGPGVTFAFSIPRIARREES
jgi:PAS domain S-box-containing protein